jgi:hypothetical protein
MSLKGNAGLAALELSNRLKGRGGEIARVTIERRKKTK